MASDLAPLRTEKIEDDVAEAEGWGAVLVVARLGDRTPDELRLEVRPQEAAGAGGAPVGVPERLPEGTKFDRLPPGKYLVRARGGDLIPQTRYGVDVVAGQRTVVEMGLELGQVFAGRVMHADQLRAIPFARVEFVGHIALTTDGQGYFDAGRRLPRRALRTIRITAPDWDQLELRHHSVPDPTNMKLYLGGGPATARCEIENLTGDVLPDTARLKVSVQPLYRVRRDIPFDGESRLVVKNLYASRYRFELHFPGGEFSTQFREVDLSGAGGEALVRFRLEPGATLKGKFIGPKLVMSKAALELRQRRNWVMARVTPDEEGRYEMRHVPAGTYIVYVVDGIGERAIETIEIKGDEIIERDLDFLRKRFAN